MAPLGDVQPRPVTPARSDLVHWQDGPSAGVRFAGFAVMHLPRGKGAVPRILGHRLGIGRHSVVHTRSGGSLAVVPRHLDTYAAIQAVGTWEPSVVDLCVEHLPEGGVFYDLGANVGHVTIEVAGRTGPDVQIVAFEAQEDLALGVAISLHLSGFADRAAVYDVMLGESDGTATLFVPRHGVHASGMSREDGSVEVERPLASIDSMVSTGQIPPPDVIKIDVEGAERLVFSGARSTIAAHRPVIVFEADDNMTRWGYGLADVVADLRSLADYRFWLIDGYDDSRREVSPDNPTDMALKGNFLAVPRA